MGELSGFPLPNVEPEDLGVQEMIGDVIDAASV
jgi:hypothetical protein